MNKDVKKIISEAFNELYNEIVSEAPEAAERTLSAKDKAIGDDMLSKVRKYGALESFKEGAGGLSSEAFNYVVNELVKDYKETQSKKAKDALQAAFFPAPGSKMLNILRDKSKFGKGSGKDAEEFQNAAASAFSDRLMRKFDDIIATYKPGTSFGALAFYNLNKGIDDWFMKGSRGKGLGGSKDVFGVGGRTSSVDDEEARELAGDPIGGGGFGGEVENQRQMLDIINGWLKNNVSNKQYIAFREMTKGNTPTDVHEEYPEIFRNKTDVSNNFSQLMSGVKKDKETGETYKPADKISELIAYQFDMPDFHINKIIPKSLRQTAAMDPEFSGTGTASRVSSPEVKELTKEFNDLVASLGPDVLNKLGIKNKNDYGTDASVYKMANKLTVLGMDNEAEEIKDAWQDIKYAREKSADYGKKQTFIDKVEDGGFGGMFEGIETFDGFDMNVLMERVMKRLSK